MKSGVYLDRMELEIDKTLNERNNNMIDLKSLKKILDEQYVPKRLVIKNDFDNLSIYNYSNEVQWGRTLWDEYTKTARGLILDDKGNIVARPFKKFFNLNDIPETEIANLPNEIPEVSDKMDGSMIILYYHDNKYKCATRGAFNSPQAQIATKIVQEKYSNVKFCDFKNMTFVFELICPEDRHVVIYNETDLYLLGLVDNQTGEEISYEQTAQIATKLGLKIPYVSKKSFDDVHIEISKNQENKEGFVLRYSNGLRVKLKTEEYCRLHKLFSGINEHFIWELCKNNEDPKKYLDKVPDEFYQWFNNTYMKLINNHDDMERELKQAFADIPKFETRKELALYLSNFKHPGIMFAMTDGKNYTEMIWKLLEPKRGGEVYTLGGMRGSNDSNN